MASRFIPPAPCAMQEGLRAYIVYGETPANCVAYEVIDDSCEPHIHRGEFVAIDESDTDPVAGELFLIRWESSGKQAVVELALRDGHHGPVWWVHSYNRPKTLEERYAWFDAGRTGGWSDGPYAAEGAGADYFRRKLQGKVIGIVQPDFRSMLKTSV